ncbi:hypothetical protein ARMSODRAFT_905635 [Armillaria solidipes]|uniref:Uncharacterized protein n=1 Tax=Armillaria solidipes TaxID=1076256 RepID=A0A2H3BZ57_9AGAR|nr:hypothetical protein ARMSODRAFT_905635 [Armillaria solidipes]
MLIRLLPAASHPTVLFAITFQNLPDDLFNPHAWTTHLSHLSVDGLDAPELVHCLDKAAFIPSILKEVTFDVPMSTISCRFVDGSTEEWPLRAPGCLQALNSVLDDVNQSALVTEREKEREKVKEKERKDGQQSLNSPPTTVKVTRHKKQRSLLMSLVASIVQLPSHTHSTSAPITRVPSPVLSKALPEQEVERAAPTLTPKALRRRARSTLVDAFRMYVAGELSRRLPSGGYYPWIIRSMLRRASDTMADLLQQAVEINNAFVTSPFEDEGYFPPPSLVTSPFSSIEDDGGDTDTDGSSVHTPSTAYFSLRSMHSRHSHVPETPTDYTSVPRHLQGLSTDELLEYQSLSSHCVRLRQLLILQEAKEEHHANEVRQRDAILEIRSRRRAWQNKALVARVGDMNVGLATPYASSRLAQVSWSGEDYEYVPPSYDSTAEEEYVEEYDEYDEKLGLGLKRSKGRSDAKLFPVSEEDEEEPFDAQEYELELGLDGLDDVDAALRAWKIEDGDDYEEGIVNYAGIGKVSIHTRIRTNSLHVNRLGARPNVNVESLPRHSSTLSATSLLCQPLRVERPPTYSKVDTADLEFGGYKRLLGDEFTLSMDVPLRMRVQEQELLMKRRNPSVLRMDANPENDWLIPRFADEGIVS